jgi:tRNA pseudouridine55 synthase
VRSIVREVGDALGCGATMSALMRTKSGMFTLDDAHTKDDIERAVERGGLRDMMIAADAAISFMPEVNLDSAGGGKFVNGTPVRISGDTLPVRAGVPRGAAPIRTRDYVRVYSSGRFLGVGVCDDDIIKPRKVLA